MMKFRHYITAAVSLLGCLMASARPTDTSSPALTFASDRGYRWSLDINACLPLQSQSLASSLISTTQGYQFNSKLYLGGGFGFGTLSYRVWNSDYTITGDRTDDTALSAALFAAIRYSALNISDRHSIMIDGRIGKWLTSGDGVYFSVAPGVRWKIKKNRSLTVSIVYNISRLHGSLDRIAGHVDPGPKAPQSTVHGLGLGASIEF